MLHAKTFPQNILAALDALAELGKAIQDAPQTPSPTDTQMVDEKTKVTKSKKAAKKNETD